MDLALTRVFCAIYEAGSVSGAAAALHVTQPTVSHALARLRVDLDDPLFARAPGGVAPTARAERLYPQFRQALHLVEQAIEETRVFEPETSARRFRIATNDIGEMFLSRLMRFLQGAAANVSVEVRQFGDLDIGRALETGRLDFAIGIIPDLGGRTCAAEVQQDSYVCMLRRGHPALGSGMSMDDYLGARHVAVAAPFSGHTEIETALRDLGHARKVVLQVNHFTSVPEIVANTDLVVTLPRLVTGIFASAYPVTQLPLPFSIRPFTVYLHWHPRSETDSGHSWLRDVIRRVLADI